MSSKPQAEGFSLDSQFRDTQAYAAELGLEVAGRWSDVDSGADWNLPGLNAMLKAARDGLIDAVICYDPDRSARSMTKQLVIEEELRRYGVPLLFARFELEDTAEGRLLKSQLSAFSEYEREKIKMRTSRGTREKIERGMVVGQGGVAPYGYRSVRQGDHKRDDRIVGLEPDPATAPIMRRIFELSETRSAVEVAETLNLVGIPGPRGERWKRSTISRLLYHPVYIGTMLYGPDLPYSKRDGLERLDGIAKVAVPPIVDHAMWDRVHTERQKRRVTRRGRSPLENDPNLLRGMIVCGRCGSALICRPAHGIRYYECPWCHPSRAKMYNHAGVCEFPAVTAWRLEE